MCLLVSHPESFGEVYVRSRVMYVVPQNLTETKYYSTILHSLTLSRSSCSRIYENLTPLRARTQVTLQRSVDPRYHEIWLGNEVQKLMSLTREAQRAENWEKYERKNPTLFLGYFFSEGTELREYLPDKSEKDHDKWLLKLVGHCGHYCVFLEQLILLVLKMSNPVADLDKVVWGVIPNFQRLLRLFCHVIMRVQQFDPDAPKLADTTESGLPASIAAEEKRRISDEFCSC